MNDQNITDRIASLVEREHQLRAQRAEGSLDEQTERLELQAAEVELDQCWDLLRQRRARREFHTDPDQAAARAPEVVERYWQ